MKLYRLIIATPTMNINRGVWAEYTRMEEKTICFLDGQREVIAMYPIDITLVTSIETKEEYEAKKEKSDPYLNYSTSPAKK